MRTRMYGGIHLYTRRAGGLIEHRIDDSNDIPVAATGAIEPLLGWPTPAMREVVDDDGATWLVGCDDEGRIIEVNV